MTQEQPITGGEPTKPDPPTGGGWVFPALLVVVLAGVAVIARLGTTDTRSTILEAAPTEWSPTARPLGETVALTIDFGNGAKLQFESLPWQKGMTVEKLLQAAVLYRPGIRFTQLGEGETGFLQSIEGLKNQGTIGRNWMYEVNGQTVAMSFCLQKLEPGDRVLWKFAGQE